MTSDSEADFIRKFLIVEGFPCSPRHCSKTTTYFSLIDDRDPIVGAYICPDNYVSRIVYFSTNPGGAWFENYLRSDRGGGDRIRSVDIRKATRHGWELGREAEAESKRLFPKGLTEYYWTFYPHTDDEKVKGNFLCEKCDMLFVKLNSSPDRICSRHTS